MSKPARQSTCHPDLPHEAKGLCYGCYQQKYRDEQRGNPLRRYKVMPIPEMDHVRILPYRAEGVRQNAVTSFPIEACPKCQRKTSLIYQGREARCAGALGGCGTTVYLVREGVGTARVNGHTARPGFVHV